MTSDKFKKDEKMLLLNSTTFKEAEFAFFFFYRENGLESRPALSDKNIR